MKRFFKSVLRLTLAAIWTVVVLILLIVPATMVSSAGVPHADKVAHFGVFAVLGLLWMAALRRPIPQRSLFVFVGGVAFGILTEYLQASHTAGRQGELGDVLADTLGLVAGIFAYRVLHRLRRAREPVEAG